MYPQIVKHTKYGRVYEVKEGVFFPSASTIASYGTPMPYHLLKWMVSESQGNYDLLRAKNSSASAIGTLAHNYAELLLAGEEIEITSNAKEVFQDYLIEFYPLYEHVVQLRRAITCFVEFYEKYKPIPVAQEELLYCLKRKGKEYILPFMGRCDLVAEIDGELWMLDYKTSRQVKGDQRISLQLSIYTWLWNETHERQIDRMGAVWLKKDYAGAKPSPRTQLLHEFTFDPSYVKSAYGMFKRFYDGFDLDGSPKTKLKVPKRFKLEL